MDANATPTTSELIKMLEPAIPDGMLAADLPNWSDIGGSDNTNQNYIISGRDLMMLLHSHTPQNERVSNLRKQLIDIAMELNEAKLHNTNAINRIFDKLHKITKALALKE